MSRRAARPALVAGLLAAAVGGCGKNDKTDNAKTAPTQTEQVGATTPTAGKPPDLTKVKGVGQTGTGVSGTFVGPVNGTAAYLAIIVKGNRASAFMSDGIQFSEHFSGTIRSGGRFTAVSEHQAHLDAKIGAKGAAGAIRLLAGKGDQLGFALRRSRPVAGYYRGDRTYRGQAVSAEWILLDGQTQHGIITQNAKPRGAPPLPVGRKLVVIPGLGRIRVHRVSSPSGLRP